ncbi:MAG: 2-C-methyl-D-erythritol 4-phosphate cytidylyltransferase [candidate division WOR-3 bacterium]|nr:MAG: 2-C-methyl-D-erythritol 4-phosphate cytidylyltransferase [candidate division WOR-3 bacterium]
MPNSAIIVAAGAGKRFGSAKQFYEWRKRPLFLYALDAFELNKSIDKIILVVPQKSIRGIQAMMKNMNYKKVHSIVAGGKRRQDSVFNGLKALQNRSGIVVIHDGVRPIVSQAMITKGIKLCRTYRAVIFALPIYDTVKKVNRGIVKGTIPRKNMYLVQTPQFFESSLIQEAYKRANRAVEYTDEAAILESLGIPVHCLCGDKDNIKITKKGDLKILDRIQP